MPCMRSLWLAAAAPPDWMQMVPPWGLSFIAIFAKFTPMYGLNEIVHAPLTGDAPGWAAVVNVVVWLAVFAGGAAWRFRRDTARV